MKKENPNSFIEEDGIRLLESFLESKKTIKTHFSRNDKTPLYDGYFNLLNQNSEIMKQFDVQIKSSEKLSFLVKGINKGKVKYEFDVDVLNSVRFKITENPTFYFVIDQTKKIIIYKLLSQDFLIDLNYTKSPKTKVTYYFSQEDILKDYDEFYNKLLALQHEINSSLCFKSSKEIIQIQKAMNEFYQKLNSLSFIKDKLFPDLWKFGLKTSTGNNKIENITKKTTMAGQCTTFAIFPINYGNQQKEIIDYFPSNSDMFTHLDFTNTFTPDKYLDDCLSKFVIFFFNNLSCIDILPTTCIQEIIFSTLNKITRYNFHIGNKIIINDELSLDEVKQILNPYFDITAKIRNNNKYYDLNHVCVKYFVSSIMDNKYIQFNENKIDDVITTFIALNELEKRNIQIVKRTWNYLIPQRETQFVHWKSDLLDSNKLSIAINKFFENIDRLIVESLDLIPIKIK